MRDCGKPGLYNHPHDAAQSSSVIYMDYIIVLGVMVKFWIYLTALIRQKIARAASTFDMTIISTCIYSLTLYTLFW